MRDRLADTARWIGAGVILSGLALRAMTATPMLPHWDIDPLTVGPAPETTLTPALALALDAAVIAAAGLIAISSLLAGRAVAWRTGLLVLIGVLGALAHGLILEPYGASGVRGELRSLTLGSAWSAALAGAWGLRQAMRTPRERVIALVAVLGLAAMLLPVGAHQVFVQHAQTMADYRADPVATLEAQGLTLGSSAALSFERRLAQPEATGWFGLANVFGAVVAAGFAGFLWLAMRSRRSRLAHVWGVAATGCLLGLWLSGSKGAVAASIAGAALAFLTLPAISRRVPRWGGAAIALAATLGPLAAIAARGAIGERIGELSLLFRWHYLAAASRIWTDHLALGVGPGGFKPAYALAKVPENPEQVQFAHAWSADWIAMLGIPGICLAAVVVAWAFLAGRTLVAGEAPDDQPGAPWRPMWRTATLAVAVAAIISFALETPALTSDAAVARLLGLLLWLGLIYAAARAGNPRALVPAAAAAGLVAIAHGQIEMTPVIASSAPWWAALAALAAGPTPAGPPGRRSGLLAAIAALFLAGLVLIAGWLPVRQWEQRLADAADLAAAARLELEEEPPFYSAAQLEPIARLIRSAADEGPASLELDLVLVRLAIEPDLRVWPGSTPGEVTARRLQALRDGPGARATARWPGRGAAWARLASAAYPLRHNDPSAGELAADAWERLAALEPDTVTPRAMLALSASEQQQPEAAARWAREALEADERLRLDPLLQMDDQRRALLERLAGAR